MNPADLPTAERVDVQAAVSAFNHGACVFYLTPGGSIATLSRQYQVGLEPKRSSPMPVRYHQAGGVYCSVYGFIYPLARPAPPKFARSTATYAIQAALEAGREVFTATSLAQLLLFRNAAAAHRG